MRIFLAALINLDPFDLAEDVAAFYAGDDENSQQTPEGILLSTLTVLPDDKLTQFALRIVLTAHTDTPRDIDFDSLAQAALVLEPPKPRTSKAKGTSVGTPGPSVAKLTGKKQATKKRAAYPNEGGPGSIRSRFVFRRICDRRREKPLWFLPDSLRPKLAGLRGRRLPFYFPFHCLPP